MADTTVPEKFRTARMVASKGLKRAWKSVGKPVRFGLSLRARTPERLLISPQDIRTADPTVAADIYAGYFAFSGKVASTHGRSPFEIAPPSEAWAAALVSFIWLRHLRAADTALSHANARVLVSDFLTQAPRNAALPIWDARVAARRLLSWLSQSPMILEGADLGFYQRFMKSLGRHASVLECKLADGLEGEARLLVAVALAELGLCSAGMPALQRRGTKLLVDELKRQILADGGHISRNPQALIDLLLDLLPLRQAYAARSIVPPKELLNAIDRMLPLLRMFRMGDGSLALFNGMGVTQPHSVATVLAYDDARALATSNAPNSGYQRIETGGAVLVLDCGASPPPAFSERAHAGQLSFELFSDGQRFVGNCGAPDEMRHDMRNAARATAAHSTLIVADTSSSRFAPSGRFTNWLEGRIVSGVDACSITRTDRADEIALSARHNGYASKFGLVHERMLRVATDGTRISGTDTLVSAARSPPAGCSYDIRFHLHPSVQAQRAEDGQSVWLWLPDGATWRFYADGFATQLEPSMFFAGANGPRNAEQIVVSANFPETPGIHWTFERYSATGAAEPQ